MSFSSRTSSPPQRFAGLTRRLADFIAHRTGTLVVLALAIAALALYVTVTRKNLDSEVLDLLPGQFPSVQGLKVFNNEFSQARQNRGKAFSFCARHLLPLFTYRLGRGAGLFTPDEREQRQFICHA